MFKLQLQQHAHGTDFTPPLSNATRNCLAALPWWRESLMAQLVISQRQQQQEQQQQQQEQQQKRRRRRGWLRRRA